MFSNFWNSLFLLYELLRNRRLTTLHLVLLTEFEPFLRLLLFLGEIYLSIANLMSLCGFSFKIPGLIRRLNLKIASCPHIKRERLVTCRSCIVPSVLTMSSFFSARHFRTKKTIYSVADSAFCRSRIFLSAGGLGTIIVVNNMGQKNSSIWILI